MSQGPAGFACDLTGADLQKRGTEWKDLMAHVKAKARTCDGFRIVFAPQVTEGLQSLVEAESACCSWATWSCESTEEGAVLEVSGPDEPIGALAEAFGV